MTKLNRGLLIGLALACCACGEKIQEKAMEAAVEHSTEASIEHSSEDGTKVDLSDQKVTMENKEGEKFEVATGDEGLKVPADFPKDVFVYPGAKIKGSIKTGDANQLMLESADALVKVAETYREKMKAEGWSEQTAAQMEGMTMLEFEKPPRKAMVHIIAENEKSSIQLVLTEDAAAPQSEPEMPEADAAEPAPEGAPEVDAAPGTEAAPEQ